MCICNRYNTKWYAAPICMQKLILIIMQRSSRKSVLVTGGLFDASIEGFATVKNIMGNFIFINSVRERDF